MHSEESLTQSAGNDSAPSQDITQGLLPDIERLRWVAASLEHENLELQQQNLILQHKLDHKEGEIDCLRNQLKEIEAENRRLVERYLEAEQQSANLTNLYVASYRLHSTLDRQEVFDAIKEIIINLIGSEELGIFELNQDSSALSLVSHFGLEPESFESIPLGSGLIGWVASTGEAYLDEKGALDKLTQKSPLTACFPLKLGDEIMGTIAVFRLLQQKNGFDESDRKLFELLATQAAAALYCTARRSAR